MSQYLILIYESEALYAAAGDAGWKEAMVNHEAFAEAAGSALQGGQALQPSGTATSIRGTGDGGYSITDGPFAETKESLGGYYIVEAPDLDAAIALGKLCPAPFGGVEVRPVMVFE